MVKTLRTLSISEIEYLCRRAKEETKITHFDIFVDDELDIYEVEE